MMDAIALPTSRSLLAREGRLRSAVDAHYDVVWRFLRRMGVPEASAEDAVQQVLLVFARRLDDVERDAERSFLLGTALRVAADFRKQHARLREVMDERALGAEASSAPDADEELDRRRARRILDDILARLPDDLRTVFVMCDLEELTMSEAAEALRVPAGTVASRLRRARETFGQLAAEARVRVGKEGRHE
jgi:RNA polymerase sigma-70 factor, ECF subfamily